MKKIVRKVKVFFIFLIMGILFHKCVDLIDYLNGPRLDINYIQSEYIGEIVRKEETNRAYFVKLKNDHDDSLKTPSISYSLFHGVEVGDFFIKEANSNYCRVIRNEKIILDSACFVALSSEDRSHWRFPEEWKGKWPDCVPYYEKKEEPFE
jgi:hypothetical protein